MIRADLGQDRETCRCCGRMLRDAPGFSRWTVETGVGARIYVVVLCCCGAHTRFLWIEEAA